MTTYWKATRSNGTDFHTGTVDYAAALKTGEPVKHPQPGREHAAEYISVATVATECRGMEWPARAFLVEADEVWTPEPDEYPQKRACHELRVVKEMPGRLLLGPQGEHIVTLLARVKTLTVKKWTALAVSRRAARDEAWYAARDYAWNATWDDARVAAWSAARDATRDAAWAPPTRWYATRDAAWDAVGGLVVRDLISTEYYDTLTKIWRTVIGPIHPDDPEMQ